MRKVNRRQVLGALGGAVLVRRPGERAHAQTPEAPPPVRPVPLISLPRLPQRAFDPDATFESAWISTLSYDSPLRPDPEGNPGTGVVFTRTIADDGLSLGLSLRPNVLYHDGTRVTVDDLVASLERARSLAIEPWRFRNIASIEVVNQGTARIALNQPDVTIPYTLASVDVPVLPNSWAERSIIDEVPPGTGPFQFIATDDDRWIYRHHPRHWSIDRPRVFGLEFVAAPSGEARSTQLLTGEVDMVVNAPLLDLPTLQQDPQINPVGAFQNRLCYLEINQQSTRLDEPEIRATLASGINRAALVTGAMAGFGTPCERLFPNDHWIAGDPVPSIEQTPEEVRQRLVGLGILPGLPLAMIAPEDDAMLATTCVLLQDQFAQAGFAVSLSLLGEEEMATAMGSGGYDLRLALSPFWRDPQELAYPLLASDGASNRGGFTNARIDIFLERATHFPFQEYRAELYQAIQDVITQLTPIVPLFTPSYVDALLNRLVGYPSIMPVSALGCAQLALADGPSTAN